MARFAILLVSVAGGTPCRPPAPPRQFRDGGHPQAPAVLWVSIVGQYCEQYYGATF